MILWEVLDKKSGKLLLFSDEGEITNYYSMNINNIRYAVHENGGRLIDLTSKVRAVISKLEKQSSFIDPIHGFEIYDAKTKRIRYFGSLPLIVRYYNHNITSFIILYSLNRRGGAVYIPDYARASEGEDKLVMVVSLALRSMPSITL